MGGRKPKRFTEEFKRSVVEDVESGRRPALAICQEFGIRGHSTIVKWCRRYGRKPYPVMNRKKSEVSQRPEDQLVLLKNRVKVLEREVADARLRQATLETLIDIAERHHAITIKKNSGGRPSTR